MFISLSINNYFFNFFLKILKDIINIYIMKQNELLTIIVAILIKKKNKKRYIVYIYHLFL